MNNKWKWFLGSILVLIVLLAPLFATKFFLPIRGYRITGYDYGWQMPMMYGGGMMGFGIMFIMWLILLGLLILIGLGIAWLIKALSATK